MKKKGPRMNDPEKPAQEVSKAVVASLKGGLGKKLVSVILFGSRARGEGDEMSDWDLLVLAEGLPDGTLTRYQFLKGLVPAVWRGRVSILGKTPGEFESYLPPLWLDIALDGVILYDRKGFAEDRLNRLKRLIRHKGLVRDSIGRDLVWRWENFPGFDWSLGWEHTT
jgi:predicted nucleotidyltransferase